jgi:hypothetical protein
MQHRIVFVGPDDDRLRQRLIDAAEDAGYRLVSDDPIAPDGDPLSIRLADVITSEREKERLMASDFRTLGDVTARTAHEVWQQLGGTTVIVGEQRQRMRHMGKAFTTICELMASHELAFADVDPSLFRYRDETAWRSRANASSRVASILKNVEVLDVYLLIHLTDENIDGFFRCGPVYGAEIKQLRDRHKR